MITSVICAAAFSVSYETTAKRIPVVLKELSSATGRTFEADSAFTNEVVILFAKDQPVQSILDKIAMVSVGRWHSVNSKLVLRPDHEKRKTQEQERMRERIKIVQKHLDYFKGDLDLEYTREYIQEGLDKQRQSRDNIPLLYAMQRRNPYSRLIMRAMLALGAERLAQVEAGDRVVYSSHPTAMQNAFPDREQIWGLFEQENEVYEAVLPGLGERQSLITLNSLRRRPLPFGTPEPPDRLESVSFAIDDPTGFSPVIRYWVMRSVGDAHGFAILGSGQGVAREPYPSKESRDPIPVTAESAEFGRVRREAGQIVDPASALGKKLLDPVTHDPLSFGSEAYLHFAKAKGKNIAVLVNDGAMGRFAFDKVTFQLFEQYNRPNVVWKDEEGWITMTPSSPVEARWNRDDRKAIGDLLRSKGPDALDRGKYLLQRPWGSPSGIGLQLGAMVHPDFVAHEFVEKAGPLRLYAALTVDQRKAESLKVGAMSAAQRKELDRVVFRQEGAFEGPDKSSLWGESTFDFPRGLSGDMTLRLVDRKRPTVARLFKGGHKVNGDIGVIASEVFWRKNPQYVKGGSGKLPELEVAAVTTQQIRFAIDSSPTKAWFAEAEVKGDIGKFGKVEDLPKVHQDALREALAEIQRWVEKGQPPILDLTRSNVGGGGSGPSQFPTGWEVGEPGSRGRNTLGPHWFFGFLTCWAAGVTPPQFPSVTGPPLQGRERSLG